MLEKQLSQSFELTREDQSDMFERFANAFLLDDYPELEGVGGKKDKGMDARIVQDSGKNLLVVQSCISPSKTARTKVLGTFGKLKDNLPKTLIYCTPSTIGLALDATKKELRQAGVTLDVCDATWFVQRALSSENRTKLAESYSTQILFPLRSELAPDRLYSEVLSETEERRVMQYLEVHSLDRKRGRNLTKSIFESLVLAALSDKDPSGSGITQKQLIDFICDSFPKGHHPRIFEIVPPRVEQLVNKGGVRRSASGLLKLSDSMKTTLSNRKAELQDREIAFRGAIAGAFLESIDENEIDYKVDPGKFEHLIHNCILWYMREQGKQLQDPVANIVSILNTEELVSRYLESGEHDQSLDKLHILDLVPSAVFKIISSADAAIHEYLRSKADLFISQAFLQSTPDVQKACKKLFGRDTIYVETTILINCTAELYEPDSPKLLLNTLATARAMGIKIKTFRPFVEEFVAHLTGPVLLEWQNHFRGNTPSEQLARMKVSPKLIEVFHRAFSNTKQNVEQIVHEIIGHTNAIDNAIEFIKEEFNVQVDDIPEAGTPADNAEWQQVFSEWLSAKNRYSKMAEDKFETLVRNDVNAYVAIRKLRKNVKMEGTNYGYKIWLLTLDKMFWKIPKLIGKPDDYLYHVAMNMDYLANFLATLATMSASDTEISLPITLISQVADFIPPQLRDKVATEMEASGNREYLKRRRIRELVHEAKTSGWELDPIDDSVAS